MEILGILIPVSLVLGGVGLVGFYWTLRSNQYDDPQGDSRRILNSDWDDRPRPPTRPADPEDDAPRP